MSPSESQERLDRLRESADASARNFRTVYVSYLVIALYILVIISSTDHDLLFRAGDVQAPVINVGMPVVWFFTFVPWILLFLHFNLMLQGTFLARKVSAFRAAVRRSTPLDGTRDEQLDMLFPAPLAHMVGGGDSRSGTRYLLTGMVVLTVAVLPIAILVYAQVQFLPYQDDALTWMHRSIVMVDYFLLWSFWPHMATPGWSWREWWTKPWQRRDQGWINLDTPPRHSRNAASIIVTLATIFFSVAIAEIPGGAIDKLWPFDVGRDGLNRKFDFQNKTLVAREPSPELLAELLAQNKNASIKRGQPDWCIHAQALDLRDRSFRYANFKDSSFCNDAIFFRADLSNANFSNTYLVGAKMENLRGSQVNFKSANLHSANMIYADLSGANLRNAILVRSGINRSILRGANLRQAKLHGANLPGVELHGADLTQAELHGTDLQQAVLNGAILRQAELHGADLSLAKFHGADLREAELYGAQLNKATFHGSNLRAVRLNGADFSGHVAMPGGPGVIPWNAHFPSAEFRGADLRGANLAGINLVFTKLILSDLRAIRLTETPNWFWLHREVKKKLTDQETKTQILEMLASAKLSNTNISLDSIENTMIGRHYEMARGLRYLPPEQKTYSPDHEAEYNSVLIDYLANDLACQDSEGYIAFGLILRAGFENVDSLHFPSIDFEITFGAEPPPGLRAALKNAPCPDTIEKGLNLWPVELPDEDKVGLRERFYMATGEEEK